jgi:hypothetical protein
MEYRLYFLGSDCRISSPGQCFQAGDDHAALEIAGSLFRAASVPYRGFELWQGSRRIHTENC